jgi:NAD(P)H-hydrate repair Nnr-like enzyme with NAD(P)H-hydrate dehydratase domain
MISGSETSGPSSPFPLGGAVAFCGSRHGSPFPVAPVVAAVLSASGSVRVGCAPGVDAAVRSCCPSAVVVRASSFPGPPRARLAARTRAVVAGASSLVVFPPAGGVLGPGSSLAVREALRRGLPVWCAGSRPSVSAPWSPLRLAGVPGFVCFPAPSLF